MHCNIVTNCIIAKIESSAVIDCALLSLNPQLLFRSGHVIRMSIDKVMLVVIAGYSTMYHVPRRRAINTTNF